MKDDIHNYKRQLERTMFRIMHPEKVAKEKNRRGQFVNFCEKNKRIASEWKDYLSSDGIGFAKIGRYMTDLIKYDKLLGKPFDEADEKDIRRVVATIEGSGLAAESKKCFKVMIRKLYRYIRGTKKKGDYPPEVEWVSIKIPKSERKLPSNLLNKEEKRNIIKHTKSCRDKSFNSLIIETGARIGEIATLKIDCITFEKHGARISIRKGKTGARSILVIWSAPYLRDWVNAHPENEDPNAYLFPNPNGDSMSYTRLAQIFKDAAKKAGINKRVYCHLARHSQATYMASHMSNAIMEAYFGWVPGSKMSGTYVHLNGEDADKSILMANDIKVVEDDNSRKLKRTECIRCNELNNVTDKFCWKCGLVLNEEEAKKIIQQDNERQVADDMMNTLMKDPEIKELIRTKLSIN